MRILFVWSAAEFSTFDVARGYSDALRRQGHEVFDFRLYNRLKYHALALSQADPPMHHDVLLVTRLASEGIVVEALKERVDLVVGVCGMGLHPEGLDLLNRAGFPIAMIFTEAPYDDEHHVPFARVVGHPFVNERVSARAHGWTYLAAAHDPLRHKPLPADPEEACDVLVVGTGWPERQALLEAVDWSGIKLRILGWWSGIEEGSPLWPYYQKGPVHNDDTVVLYSSAKVCINQHRAAPGPAESLNPRAYELAACEAYQVSDWRAELKDVFGDSVPVYRSAGELEFELRRALSWSPGGRRRAARLQRERLVAGRHTFDDRVGTLMAEITGGLDDGKDSRQGLVALPAGRGRAGSPVLERG